EFGPRRREVLRFARDVQFGWLLPFPLLFATASCQCVVLGVRVRHDQGGGGLLGVKLVAVGDADADGGGVEEAGDEEVVGEVGAGGVAPGVAFALVGGEVEGGAEALVGVFGEAFGGLDGEAVAEEALGVFAGGLEAFGAVGGVGADGDDLEGG